MSTVKTWEEASQRLSEPFPEKDIEWRMGQCGKKGSGHWAKALAYLTNRAIMDRLDEVVGPGNWKNEFCAGPQGGVMCGISLRLPMAPEWVTKWDAAENTQIESVKGGVSDAMKRAAVHWGIGRYLYRLDAGWCDVSATKKNGYRYQGKGAKWDAFYWLPPALPAWALPGSAKPKKKPAAATARKYKADDPNPSDLIIEGIRACETIEELTKFYKENRQDIEDNPKKDQIIAEFSVHKGELEIRGGA